MKILHRTPEDVDPRWFKMNVPAFECPNADIEAVYDYRWSLVSKHLRYANAHIGYVATEFNTMEDTWSGRYGAISCSAELQLNELRWLRDTRYVEDYLAYWLDEGEGYAQNYSWSVGKAAEEVCAVLGDWSHLSEGLAQLIEHQRRWDAGRVCYPNDRGFDREHGLYWNTGRDSSGEFNLASCQLDEELRGIEGYKIRGGAGYRADVNANMYGNLCAIAHAARLRGDTHLQKVYTLRAEKLRRTMLRELWEPSRVFFIHRWRYDEYAQGDAPGKRSIDIYSFLWETNRQRDGGAGFQMGSCGCLHGRELSQYWVWQYDMTDEKGAVDYDAAWKLLRDETIFEAPYGPCSAERADPWFSVIYGECRMNGNSWPMLTSKTLTALKHVLQTRRTQHVKRSDFYELMDIYTRTQFKEGEPFCAESHDPFQPRWTVDRQEGRHYFHSSYCDLILSGLMGIIPKEEDCVEIHPLFPVEWAYCAVEGVRYHGRELAVYWDAQGTRYGMGPGLSVVVNGVLAAKGGASEHLRIDLSNFAKSESIHYVPEGCVNLAINNDHTAYPRITTSVRGGGRLESIHDGRVWYHNDPINGWISEGSPNDEDYVIIDFGGACDVFELRFALCELKENGIALPQSVGFETWVDNAWRDMGRYEGELTRHTVHIMPMRLHGALRLRMRLRHQTGFQVGLIEWEIWGKAVGA